VTGSGQRNRGFSIDRAVFRPRDIQQAIATLSPEDRAKLRHWLAEFEAGQVEREPETKASKLGRLAGRAVADFRKRMRGPS
jgi:hypothetical protein